MSILFTITRRGDRGVAPGEEQQQVTVNWVTALGIPLVLAAAALGFNLFLEAAKLDNAKDLECHKHAIASPGAAPPACR